MQNHNFRRFIIFIGLTFTLMLGIFTTPAFAQEGAQQNNSAITTGPGPVVTAFVYNFPSEDITYTESKIGLTPSSFDYKDQHFEGDQIRVVNAEFGKAVSVSPKGIDVITNFTLLLSKDSVKNGDKIKAVGITVTRVLPRTITTTSYEVLDGTVKFKI